MTEYIVRAKDLRKESELDKVPKGIGYYKWYAEKQDLNLLLRKLGLSFDSIPQDQWDIENGLYCIYLGIAKKSLRERLDWHVNDHHTINAVRSGALSTFRQSLSSVLFSDQSKEQDTNSFIDRLTIHFFYFENLNSESDIDKKTIEAKETGLINQYLHILNGSKNHNCFRAGKRLRELRMLGKAKGIEQLSSKL